MNTLCKIFGHKIDVAEDIVYLEEICCLRCSTPGHIAFLELGIIEKAKDKIAIMLSDKKLYEPSKQINMKITTHH